MLENAKRFVELARAAGKIDRSRASDETKYTLIFSDDIAGAMRETGYMPDYCDPDTSYAEDVAAFVDAVMDRARDIETALEAI